MEQFTNCKSNSFLNSTSPQKGTFSMSWLTKHPNRKKIKLSSSITDYFSQPNNDNQVQPNSIDGQLSLVPSPDKSKNIRDKNNTIGNGLFKDIILEKCNVNNISKKALSNSVSFECSKTDNFPLDKKFSDYLAVENSRISDNSSKTTTEPAYSVDSLKEDVPKTLPKLLDIGFAEKSLEHILTEDIPINIEKNGNSEEIQSKNSSNFLYKLLTSKEFMNTENCRTHPETISDNSSKTATEPAYSVDSLKEDVPKTLPKILDIGHSLPIRDTGIGSAEKSLEHILSEEIPISIEKNGNSEEIQSKNSSNFLYKLLTSKEFMNMENCRTHPETILSKTCKKITNLPKNLSSISEQRRTEDLGSDQNISTKESSRKDDASKSQSENCLIVSKVARRQSAKKAMQKFVSQREALEDLSLGSEACLTEESGNDQNISSIEDSPESWSERNPLSFPKVARRLSAKKAMQNFVSQREALEDLSLGSEECLTEELGNDQNISSIEGSPESWSERNPLSFSKVAKQMSAKNAMQKFFSQREALEDVSSVSKECPSEESASDQNISTKESSRKDDASKSQSENCLIVPKVAKRMSAKKAMQNFVSLREALEDLSLGSEACLTEESGNDQNISSIEDSPESWSARNPLSFPKVAMRMSAKNAMQKFVSQREALEDLSLGSEACLTEESGNDQNISSIEDSPESWPERNPLSLPKVAKRMSAKNPMQKFISQREALEDVSSVSKECPSEESRSDQNISTKESSSKDDALKCRSENCLIVPKVARRLSTKNAMQKFVSKRESASRNSKKWLQRKKVTYDDDFLNKEWDRLNNSSESEDENSPDSTSNGHYKCHICQRSYMHYKSLKRHLQTHSKYSRNVFTCLICGVNFGQKSDLMKHERSHDKKRLYKCDECGKDFTQLSSLKRHERIHRNMKSYSCDHCDATFSQSNSLKRHQKIHEEMPKEVELFTCEFCKESFKEKHHLQAHINSLHGSVSTEKQRQYTCNICGAMFLRHSSFWLHKKIHDRNKSDAYKCQVCSKLFSTKSNLTRHCRHVHSEMDEEVVEKPFKCLVCNEQFSTIVSLKLHIPSHNTKDLYHCVLCEKTFTHKQWLIKHMASHRGSKYACEQCGRAFRGSFQLKLHKRSTGEKCTPPVGLDSFKAGRHHLKYVCQYCNQRCSLSSRLAKHVRKAHPEVEVFTCDVCDKGFCYYLDFLSHRKTHSNIPYQCKPCGVAFPRLIQLFEHRKKHLKPLDTSAASSASNVPADTGVLEKSSKPETENNLGVEPGLTVSCSKMESDNSAGAEALNAEILKNPKVPEKISNGLRCQHCCLVFLSKLGYRRHCRLAHGEEKFLCRKCGSHFDHLHLYNLHLKNSHGKPMPKPKVGRKRKSDKLVKPKTAPKYDSAKLQKLLWDRVKESMKRSKLKRRSSFGAKENKNKTFTVASYVID